MTEQTTVVETWLTQADFDRLSAELAHLSGPGRDEIVEKIETARAEGDLKENGGYHAAKDEQGKMEARIRQLTELLRDAKVGEAPDTGGRIAPGMVVEVRFAGDDDTEKFLLGSREGAGGGLEVYSPQSPLGAALVGHQAGETVSYEAPNGTTMAVEVIGAEPWKG